MSLDILLRLLHFLKEVSEGDSVELLQDEVNTGADEEVGMSGNTSRDKTCISMTRITWGSIE